MRGDAGQCGVMRGSSGLGAGAAPVGKVPLERRPPVSFGMLDGKHQHGMGLELGADPLVLRGSLEAD